MSRDDTVVIEDVLEDERVDDNLRSAFEQAGMRSVVACPLRAAGRWVGIVSGQGAEPLALSMEELRRINSLMDQSATVASSRLTETNSLRIRTRLPKS